MDANANVFLKMGFGSIVFWFCGYLSISSDWEWERTLKNDSSKRSNRSQANRDDGERERRAHLRDVPIRGSPDAANGDCDSLRLRTPTLL